MASTLLVNTTLASTLPDWVEDYGYTGKDKGRIKHATLSRKATMKNPWKSVKNKSMRLQTRAPSADALPVLLDAEARASSWYCIDMERESAVALVETLMPDLVEGSFIITSSRKDFAMLTCVVKSNIYNVPIDADMDGAFLKLKDVKVPPHFRTTSELVKFYSSKKQKGMPCKLNTKQLDVALSELPDAEPEDEYFEVTTEVEGLAVTSSPTTGQQRTGMENPGYTDVSRPGLKNPMYQPEQSRKTGLGNPGYNGQPGQTGTGSYSMPVAISPSPEKITDEHEGYITISQTSFSTIQGINGVTFQPCQTDEWFFMGISNSNSNHHGGRDQHYDDIDFCIGVMGHGKATARENEDEVGPYVEYKSDDTFTIRINPKTSMVEFAKNKKVFHTSKIGDPKEYLWAVQAFHPINGTDSLIKNSSWLKK